MGSEMCIRDRAYTESSGASVITDTLVLSDVDDMNLERATIQVTGNYINGEDILSFTDTATISSSFDPLTGTLTLMGTDTVANYQAALRLVTYENLSDDPQASKTVTFTVSDDEFDSNTQNRTINISAVNDAPVGSAIEQTPLAYAENSGPSAITNTLVVSDVDDMNLEGATIQVTGNYINGEDILSFADTTTISSSFDPLTGTCLLYTSPSPRDLSTSRMPSSA